MFKRDYVALGVVHKKDNSSFRSVYKQFTQRSFFPDSIEVMREFIDTCKVQDDEALVIHAFNRVPRWL